VPASPSPNQPSPDKLKRSRVADSLDPILIRQVRGIAWAWLAVFVASAAVFQAIAVQLPNPAWLLLPGWRSSSASVHAFLPLHLLLVSWGGLLFFVICALGSREFTRPTRAWPMVMLTVLGCLGATFYGTLVTSAILQLGHNALSASAARSLLAGPGQSASSVAAIVAIVSLIAVPGLLAAARAMRRGRR
jgi:hypothetical protein